MIMIKCSPEAFAKCKTKCHHCGSEDVAYYLEGSDCDKFNKEVAAAPKTNADRIRAMSDEELAKWMAERNVNESTVHLINKDHGLTDVQIQAIRHNVYCGLMKWLKQPAEVKDNA